MNTRGLQHRITNFVTKGVSDQSSTKVRACSHVCVFLLMNRSLLAQKFELV